MFCSSLFVLFFLWTLCCQSFFDLRILNTPLVSSNSSCMYILNSCLISQSITVRLFKFIHCVIRCPCLALSRGGQTFILKFICKDNLDDTPIHIFNGFRNTYSYIFRRNTTLLNSNI